VGRGKDVPGVLAVEDHRPEVHLCLETGELTFTEAPKVHRRWDHAEAAVIVPARAAALEVDQRPLGARSEAYAKPRGAPIGALGFRKAHPRPLARRRVDRIAQRRGPTVATVCSIGPLVIPVECQGGLVSVEATIRSVRKDVVTLVRAPVVRVGTVGVDSSPIAATAEGEEDRCSEEEGGSSSHDAWRLSRSTSTKLSCGRAPVSVSSGRGAPSAGSAQPMTRARATRRPSPVFETMDGAEVVLPCRTGPHVAAPLPTFVGIVTVRGHGRGGRCGSKRLCKDDTAPCPLRHDVLAQG